MRLFIVKYTGADPGPVTRLFVVSQTQTPGKLLKRSLTFLLGGGGGGGGRAATESQSGPVPGPSEGTPLSSHHSSSSPQPEPLSSTSTSGQSGAHVALTEELALWWWAQLSRQHHQVFLEKSHL